MKRKLWCLLVLSCLNDLAHSADAGERLRFSGFGTLAVSQSDEDQGDYRANIEQSTGVGRTHRRDTGLDSVLGLQADLDIAARWTATAQVVSRRLSDYKSSRPYLEWGNIKHDLDEYTYLRAGRFVSPTFMISESRMIGISQLPVRPVAEVYLLSPITYMNGVDAGRKFVLGEALVKARGGIGRMNQSINQINGTLNFKFAIKSFDVSTELDGSTFRLGYQRISMDVTSPGLDSYDQAMDTLVANGVANAAQVKAQMKHKQVPIDFYVLGYAYDKGPYVFQAEYAHRQFSTDFVQSLAGYYVLGGYRIGRWTPYASLSRLMHKSDVRLPPLDASSAGALSALVDGVNAGSALRIHRQASSLGVRYELQDNVALKLQYDRITKPKDSIAEFVNTTGEFFSTRRKIHLVSAALDFAF